MSDRAWTELVTGHETMDHGATGELPTHRPMAAVLTCSDARLPAAPFARPAGELFVVRIAGNTAAPVVLASLGYAVAELDVSLIVVLGHYGCGAVGAAAAGPCDGYLEPIVAPIREVVDANPGADIDRLVELNVVAVMSSLAAENGPVGQAVRTGDVEIRGAVHDLRHGRLIEVPAGEGR